MEEIPYRTDDEYNNDYIGCHAGDDPSQSLAFFLVFKLLFPKIKDNADYCSDKSMVFFANNGINIAFDRNVFEYIAKLSAKGRESARGLHRKCDTAFGCAVDFAVQNPKQSRQNGIYVKMMGNAIVANVPQSFTRRQIKAIQKHSAFLKS